MSFKNNYRVRKRESESMATLTFQGLHSVLLWTPTICKIMFLLHTYSNVSGGGNCEAIQETTFFFHYKTKFFCFTTLIQLPMAHIKITFLIIFFDRVPQLPAFNGSGY
jgi:hypothetical protein